MTTQARGLGRLAAVAFGLVGAAASEARAGVITYTESAVAGGTLGSQSFADATVTLTFVGDTAGVENPSPALYVNPVGTATVTVAGVGTATFTDQIRVFDDQTYAVGFTDVTINRDILDQAGGTFNTYDLKTAVGPVTGVLYPGIGDKFATDEGALVLTSASPTATFTAATPAVPEPSAYALAGVMGAAGVAGAWLRRERGV